MLDSGRLQDLDEETRSQRPHPYQRITTTSVNFKTARKKTQGGHERRKTMKLTTKVHHTTSHEAFASKMGTGRGDVTHKH